ncbi:MAG: class I SAM-dependent methyltransferase, partial [Treponema sp.]|nr:class I SAM-dependent methyltransferase [Treponema sp.]
MKNKGLQRHIKTLVYLAPDKTPLWRKTQAALLRLQRGLTGERKLAGRQYMEENDLLSAYLLYYWPVSYQQVSCIIKNMTQKPFPREKISILDIGSGPGPASAALCDHLISSQHISGKDICVCHADYSEKALSLASRIFSRDFPEIQAEAIPCKIGKELMNKLSVPKARSFSIAIFCHSLNELWQDAKDSIQRRAGFIKELMDSHMEEHSLL